MPVIRSQPGEIARFSSTYVLRGHYGEDLGLAVWCNAGERLPLTAVAVEHEAPACFIPVDESAEVIQAA